MADYIYKQRGGALVQWKGGVSPAGSRAAETRGMGCACDDKALIPLPGAPEIVGMGNYVATGDTTALTKLDDAIHSGVGRKTAAAAMAYHGYKRNGSVLSALLWAGLGYIAPVLTPVVSVAQGFGHKKGG